MIFSISTDEPNTTGPRWVYMDILASVLPDPVGLPTSSWNKGITLTLNGDSLSILHRHESIIVLLRHRLHAFWRRLGQLLDKSPYGSRACQPLGCTHQIENKPGEPRNTAKAGTTVFGGSTVLSSIFAQSLIIQNFPCQITNTSTNHVSVQCSET